jgi:hypothetical protein
VRKALGVILLIFVLSVIVYVLFYNTAKNESIHGISYVSEGRMHEMISMRQIDSLSADLNYRFTIKNKVIHPVSPDSLKIPLKGESPAG